MNPFLSLSENFDHFLRHGITYLVITVFFLLDLISLSSVGAGLSNFPFFLINIYYWSLYRPAILPIWLTFIAGIITDIISGAPLGLNAALFVFLRWAIAHQRLYLTSQTFVVMWLGFCVALAFSLIFQWFVISVIALTFSPIHDFGFAMLSGIAIFPLVVILLHLAHKILPMSEARMRIL